MDLQKRIEFYLSQETEPVLRAEILDLESSVRLGDAGAQAELIDRFTGELKFGTAGFRARVEGGFSRFNNVTVARVAWAIGKHLLSLPIGAGVVVGFDGRLSSRSFADQVEHVLMALGIVVLKFKQPCPTPLCAYAVPYLGACAGIMITASHNPAADNGLKLYGPKGAQMMSPHDQQIEQLIQSAPALNEITGSSPALSEPISDSVEASYLSEITRGRFHQLPEHQSLSAVYTPLHGVGGVLALKALAQAGFSNISVVTEQFNPDGHFPTVRFPNPEEEGTLDLALALAHHNKADVVFANDPDADRLAVAIRHKENFVQLSGNQIGWLLGFDVLKHGKDQETGRLVISTIVSSRLLAKMAPAFGATYVDTLTGFGRIASEAIELERDGHYRFVFGYEEAIGFCIGNLVRDKDGIAALVRMAELIEWLKTKNRTVFDLLDDIEKAYGVHRQLQWSVRFDGLGANQKMQNLMTAFRSSQTLWDGVPLMEGSERHDLKPVADVLRFESKQNVRLVIRPSGTEPKIKFYLEHWLITKQSGDVSRARSQADEVLQQIKKVVDNFLPV